VLLQGYQSVLADVATYTGMLTLASMVVSRLVFQYAGWGVAASVTPAVMGLAGVVFFGATLASQLPALTPELAATIAGVGATAGVVTQVSWWILWALACFWHVDGSRCVVRAATMNIALLVHSCSNFNPSCCGLTCRVVCALGV
jgi:hypothetical protein